MRIEPAPRANAAIIIAKRPLQGGNVTFGLFGEHLPVNAKSVGKFQVRSQRIDLLTLSFRDILIFQYNNSFCESKIPVQTIRHRSNLRRSRPRHRLQVYRQAFPRHRCLHRCQSRASEIYIHFHFSVIRSDCNCMLLNYSVFD